jgi:hypothetical protein
LADAADFVMLEVAWPADPPDYVTGTIDFRTE